MPFFDLRIRWVELTDFGPKSGDLRCQVLGQNLATWAIGLSNQILSRRSYEIGLHKQAHPFLRSTNTYQKLGNGSRKNQPNVFFFFASFFVS